MEIYRKLHGKNKPPAGLFLALGALIMLFQISGPSLAVQTQTAVIATVAPDYSSAAHSVISVDPVGGPRSVRNNLLPTGESDIAVSAHGNYFYRIGRFQSDNVAKLDIASPSTVLWQFSTMDPGEVTSSNPYQLVFVSSEKAYLLRYGSTKAWIVNPSTTSEAGFKTGELDLGAYAAGGEVPKMCCGVIAKGRLFIVLQRLDSYFCPSNTPYVAVFDVETDEEIDTGQGEGALKGIPLPVKDPVGIQYLAQDDTLYLVGVGSYPGFCDPKYDYTGGIISIDPETYATTTILDDGDAADHPYGNISGMFIVSPEKGYFVGYDGWQDNSLYKFNPSSGSVDDTPISGFEGIGISAMDSGLNMDKNGMLWVCVQTDHAVKIVDTADDTVDESISTSLNPQMVVFCTEGEPAPTAGFTADKTAGPVPLTVAFTDLSTGPVTSWSWDFGDSSTGDAANPTHTYNEAGSYTVTLTVTGAGGTDTLTRDGYILAADLLYVDYEGSCGGKAPCYTSIHNAVSDAGNTTVLRIRAGTYPEDLVLDESKTLALQCGWNDEFTTQSSLSSVLSLTITKGTVSVDRLRLTGTSGEGTPP